MANMVRFAGRQIMSRYKKLAVTGRYTVDNVKIVWPTLTFAEICTYLKPLLTKVRVSN